MRVQTSKGHATITYDASGKRGGAVRVDCGWCRPVLDGDDIRESAKGGRGLWLDLGAGLSLSADAVAAVARFMGGAPTRACDKCGRLIREGYGTEDGGAYCSLACAEFTQAEYNQFHDEYANGGAEPYCYWTEWEESDLPEATEEERARVSALLKSRGWTREHTGGGCTGWLFELHTGELLLLTEAGEPFAALAFNAPCVVGVYAPEQFMEEPTSYAYCATLGEALGWSARYVAWVAAKPESVNAPLRGAV